MRIRMLSAALALALPRCAGIDPSAAQTAYREVRAICERDNGQLWGVSLCGPILFVEPSTRDYITESGDTGKLPTEYNMANTAFDWKGSRWTMVLWPLPDSAPQRASLLSHELWHRIQGRLGLDGPNNGNNHLDSVDGRVLLQLEWRALTAALESSGEKRTANLRDAIAFRAERRRIFPAATVEETGLEITEGLAEYTGVRLSGEPLKLTLQSLHEADRRKTFVRSFAYVSGPAWGLLLDDESPGWRKRVTLHTDLASLLPTRPACSRECLAAATARFDGAELRNREEQRATQNRERLDQYRAALVDGPVLILPMTNANIQFDPGNLVPLESHGTVYPTLRVAAAWGTLDVTSSAALISPDFSTVRVPVSGTGYVLKLKEGWGKQPVGSAGSLRIQRAE